MVDHGCPAQRPRPRLALTLRAVIGLTTPQIARAFLVNEQTLSQRIVRAKRKIVAAVVAHSLPEHAEAWGLAALLRIQHGRAAARFTAGGDLVLLRNDPSPVVRLNGAIALAQLGPRQAERALLELTGNDAERRLIQTRLRRHPLTDGS